MLRTSIILKSLLMNRDEKKAALLSALRDHSENLEILTETEIPEGLKDAVAAAMTRAFSNQITGIFDVPVK